MLVVVGAFWSSIDAAKKNEQIAQSITGGDSYPIIDPSFVQGEDNTLLLMLITIGKISNSDLQITTIDQDLFSGMLIKRDVNGKITGSEVSEIADKATKTVSLGNLGPEQGKMFTKYPLDPKIGVRNLYLTLMARNGQVREDIKVRRVNNKWVMAFRAQNQKGTLEQRISPDFPPDQIWTN